MPQWIIEEVFEDPPARTLEGMKRHIKKEWERNLAQSFGKRVQAAIDANGCEIEHLKPISVCNAEVGGGGSTTFAAPMQNHNAAVQLNGSSLPQHDQHHPFR